MNKHTRSLKAVKMFHDGDGNALHNVILADLTRKGCESLLSKLEFVELPTHMVLSEMGERIKFAYFINSGLASVLNVMSDGKSVEVGLAGKEGFIGLPLVVGFDTSPTHVVMQIGGSGFRVRAQDLGSILRACPALEKRLNRYSQEMTLQVSQVAACNRLHEVEERLARWLLMSQDRVGASTFPLTQQFLAHMLGTRRASVTVAAGILQRAGLITYQRGLVKIESRNKLELAACECYSQLNQQIRRWHKPPLSDTDPTVQAMTPAHRIVPTVLMGTLADRQSPQIRNTLIPLDSANRQFAMNDATSFGSGMYV